MSSGFVTESEAADIRKKRQEEWEKVRRADDPVERPEEPYDCRSLYDRLQEQKQKKDLEYEEAHKLKNMIKGLDDDEIEFLDLVDRTKLAADRKINIEEEKELNDYRNRVATLQEKALDQKLQAEVNMRKPKNVTKNRNSQVKLLQGVVVKKDGRKRKHSDVDENGEEKPTVVSEPVGKESRLNGNSESSNVGDNPGKTSENGVKNGGDVGSAGGRGKEDKRDCEEGEQACLGNTGLTCIGILPGLGCYNDSSSEMSSDSDQEEIQTKVQIDILGRKIVKKEKDS